MTNDSSEKIARELRTAIDQLRVEIWAGALSGFAKPIPDYEGGSDDKLLTEPPRKRDAGTNH